MKNSFTLALLLIAVFTQAQETLDLSIERSVELALENNQDLKNAQLDVDYANYQVKEVLSTGLPQITGNVNFTHNLEIATTVLPDFISPSVYGVLFQEGVIPPKDITVGSLPAQFGVPFSMQATAGMNQLIFDGTFFLGLKAASEFVKINELLASKSEIDVKEAVMKAYYMALISDQNLGQLNKSLTNLNKMKEETQALYDAGFAEKLDVDRLILSVSNLEININKLKNQAELAKKILLASMGMDINTDIRLTSDIPEFSEGNFNMSYGLNANGGNRIELKMLEQQQRLNELSLKRWQMGYVPSLYLNANYGYNTFAQKGELNKLGDPWYPIASYGLNLNIPIFDGLYKRSKANQVRVDILKTENTINQLNNGINLEVKRTQSDYLNAYKNMELQKKSADLAQQIYNTTSIKFKEGVGSSFELVQAESDLTTANTNYLNALYELNIAKIALDKALGNI